MRVLCDTSQSGRECAKRLHKRTVIGLCAPRSCTYHARAMPHDIIFFVYSWRDVAWLCVAVRGEAKWGELSAASISENTRVPLSKLSFANLYVTLLIFIKSCFNRACALAQLLIPIFFFFIYFFIFYIKSQYSSKNK